MTSFQQQVNSDSLDYYFESNKPDCFVANDIEAATNPFSRNSQFNGNEDIDHSCQRAIRRTRVPHSQSNTDWSVEILWINGGISRKCVVAEGYEVATDPNYIHGRLTSLVVETGRSGFLHIGTLDSYRPSLGCLSVQNNAVLTLKNPFNSIEDPLGKIYSLERAKQHHAASKAIFRYIETNFADFNLTAVNLMLNNVELKELSALSIVGLVRFTARAKNHLPAWAGVYRKAKEVLEDKGANPERVLVGIKE